MNDQLKIFSGRSNPNLSKDIAKYLGKDLGRLTIKTFSDGELWLQFEENVRGCDVFIIQPTNSPAENIMELILIIDAAVRASAKTVTAVIPYFGYSRQDRRPRNTRGPVSAKLVADLIETADIKRVITVDLHADQIEGFFSIPVDNIYSSTILMSDMWRQGYSDQVIVSPDVGGVGRARAIARRLGNASLAIIDKRREAANQSEVMNIIGDVDQKTAIIFDDMVDTAGTLCNPAAALNVKGAFK